MREFSGKVAAITGAASGIGRALALALARRGCHVALSDVNEAEVAKTAETARVFGVGVTQARVDVADRIAMHAWAARVAADHGKVNLIFNNAGVSVASAVDGIDYGDFEWIMGINFWGVVYGTKAFLPYLKASGEGHVVNISSVFGLIAQPGQGAYNASKFAVRGFTEALSQELRLQRAPVGVTCVHPGGIRTGIAQSSRYSPSMERLTGLSERQAKRDFDRFLVTAPDEAARVILRAVEKNRPRVLIGRDARFLDRLQRLLPAAYQNVMLFALRRHMRKAAARATDGVASKS